MILCEDRSLQPSRLEISLGLTMSTPSWLEKGRGAFDGICESAVPNSSFLPSYADTVIFTSGIHSDIMSERT